MVDSKQRRLHRNLEDPGEGQGSGAHMISTARVPADKPVRIAFSLDNASDDTPPEDSIPLVFPELDQQLQPLPPCHDSVESMQVFKQHCQIAEEYNEVKKEIALLEERNAFAAITSLRSEARPEDAGISMGRDQGVLTPRRVQEVEDDRRVRHRNKCISFSIFN
uniref:MAP3K7 C-terminal like n=1 Tax=Felis catus TaxID=9685 RepID=A0ABI7XCI7_FELCA